MRVEYSFVLNGRNVTVSEECESDTAAFKFLNHMDELYGNVVCEREGQVSDKVRINVRTDKEENDYYEMVCVDRDNLACHFARRKFGVNKKGGGLFPKNKDDDGNWRPWAKYNKETGKEE